MAFLYIDRLKSDFQRVDHRIPQNAGSFKKWCPQAFIKRLSSQKFDERCCVTEEFQVKKASVSFAPKVPKIFTIGLRLDANNANARQSWNIAVIKNLLKHFVRRYRNYFRSFWKSTPSDNHWNVLASTKTIISKCTKKFKEKSPVQESDCIMLCREKDSPCKMFYDFEEYSPSPSANTESYVRLWCDDDENRTQKEVHPCDTYVADGSNNRQNKLSGGDDVQRAARGSPVNRSKQSVSVQTTEKSKLRRRKSRRNTELDQKENVCYVSTNTSLSQDIETIFTTNSANFNYEKSRSNLEVLGTHYMKEVIARKQRNKKWKSSDTESSRKRHRINTSTNVRQDIFDWDSKEIKKKSKHKKSKESTFKNVFSECNHVRDSAGDSLMTIYQKHNSKSRNESLMLVENENCAYKKCLLNKISDDSGTACNDTYFPSNENSSNRNNVTMENSIIIKSNINSPGTVDTSLDSQNYLVEDKTSELMILGKVKKRLEEDFSLNHVNCDNDLFLDAEDDLLELNRSSSEMKLTSYELDNKMKRSKSMMTTASVTKHQAMKQESKKQSIRSLTCDSSIRFSNSDLSRAQSSYHTTLREQECSPSSSVEYCTASNVSLAKFSRSNSFNALFQPYEAAYDDSNNKTKSHRKNCFSSNVSLGEDSVYQDTRDFLDSTLGNSFTMCCYQRNSTPNFSNSSKLVTESLDSGILTDCSREHVQVASNERLRGKTGRKSENERKRYSRETNLLPTYDFNTDSSYSDESLNRRVDMVVKKFTENLILTERRAKSRLKRMENPALYRQGRKRRKNGQQVRSETIIVRCACFNWKKQID